MEKEKVAQQAPEWWKEVTNPIFEKERMFEYLVTPTAQRKRFRTMLELGACYGLDTVLYRTSLSMTSRQMDIFLNEYAPNARDDDERGYNMKAMALIRKIHGKVPKEEGEVSWWKDANPVELRDTAVRMDMATTPQQQYKSDEEMELYQDTFDRVYGKWANWPRGRDELSLAMVDDAIVYVFWKHKQSGGVFNGEGWNTTYPDRYLWNAEDGKKCMTKLNACLWMKLHLIESDMVTWMELTMPTGPAKDVDALVGAMLQGAIRIARKFGLPCPEERERVAARKRGHSEVVLQPCREYPGKCRRDEACKYIHARRY